LGVLRQSLDVFNRNGIDLVYDVDALDVLAIAFNGVNEVAHVVVSVELDVSVVDLVLVHDSFDHPLVNQCQGDGR